MTQLSNQPRNTHPSTQRATLCPCSAPLPETHYLCHQCRRRLWEAVGNIPAVVAQLEITMAKQNSHSHETPTISTTISTQPLPYNEPAGKALTALQTQLTYLVGRCLKARLAPTISTSPALPDNTSPQKMSAWLLCRLAPLTKSPWAEEAMGIVKAVEKGFLIIDRPPDEIYAGPCDECGTDLYGAKKAAQVTCAECGQQYDTRTRREWLLGLVHDRLATSTEIATALTTLALPVTPERIRQWKRRDRLTVRAYTPGAGARRRPLYRVGDVVELLRAEAIKAAS